MQDRYEKRSNTGCREIVERVFDQMRACGQPESYALEAALTVYHYHQPAMSEEMARALVERWAVGQTLH